MARYFDWAPWHDWFVANYPYLSAREITDYLKEATGRELTEKAVWNYAAKIGIHRQRGRSRINLQGTETLAAFAVETKARELVRLTLSYLCLVTRRSGHELREWIVEMVESGGVK